MTSAACVKRYCFAQSVEITCVHVGLGQHDVAQAGHPKTGSLTRVAAGCSSTGIKRATILFGYAEHSDLLIGEQGWGVALGTTSDEGAKDIESFDFRFG